MLTINPQAIPHLYSLRYVLLVIHGVVLTISRFHDMYYEFKISVRVLVKQKCKIIPTSPNTTKPFPSYSTFYTTLSYTIYTKSPFLSIHLVQGYD